MSREGGVRLQHGRLGEVQITVRRNAQRFVARWKGGVVHLTVPVMATQRDVLNALDELEPRLLARKPSSSLYAVGRSYKFEFITVTIVGVDNYGKRCTLHRRSMGDFEVRVDTNADLACIEGVELVSRMMKSIARYLAPALVLSRARAVSSRLGVSPREWQLSSGRKVLGRCDARGVIRLSSLLVFAPGELIDYVVCHELAHLSEMNHSARFHAVCDRYCGGRAKELEVKLKAFRFPFP